MHQRDGDGRDGDGAEQGEGECRADEPVDAMGGVDSPEQDEGAGPGQDRRDIGAGRTLHRHPEAGAADEFGTADQHQPERGRHGEAHAGAENAGLDGVADQEQATERQRDAADPDRPARAERRFDIGLPGCPGRRRRLCRDNRLRRFGQLLGFGRSALACLGRRLGRPGSVGRHCSGFGCRVTFLGRDSLGCGGGSFIGRGLRHRAGGRRGQRDTGEHQAAQRAKLALDQSDAGLLARDDDEQSDDGGNRNQAEKHGAVPLKTGPVLADKCGDGTASQISALPAFKIEHVSKTIASNLIAFPMPKRRHGLDAPSRFTCRRS